MEITGRAKISPEHTTWDTYLTPALVVCFKDCTKLVNVQLYTNSLSTHEDPSQTLS